MKSSILKHMSVAVVAALALACAGSVWAATPFTFTFNAGVAMDSSMITDGTIPDKVSPLAFSRAAAIKTSAYYTAYFVTGKTLRDAGYPGMTATAIGGASDVQNWVKGTSGTDEFTTRMSVVMKDAVYVVQDARSEITDNFTVVVDKDKYSTMPASDEALFVVLAYHNPDYANQYGIIVARILPTAWNGQSSCTIWSAGSEFSGTYAGRTGTFAPTYAVTLNKNGGECDDVTNYTAGVVKTLPTATKTDCEFGGWYTNALFEGVAWTAIGASEEGDKEFWAKWLVQTPQAVKDDDNQDVTVTVSEAWMASNNVEKANLDTDGSNGIKIWKSYVLGLDPNDANSTTVVTPVQTTDPANLTINLGSNFKPQTDAGVNVMYRLYTSDGSEWTEGADEQESPSFTTALPTSGVKYYKIVSRFYKK